MPLTNESLAWISILKFMSGDWARFAERTVVRSLPETDVEIRDNSNSREFTTMGEEPMAASRRLGMPSPSGSALPPLIAAFARSDSENRSASHVS